MTGKCLEKGPKMSDKKSQKPSESCFQKVFGLILFAFVLELT